MGPFIELPSKNIQLKYFNMRDHFAGMAMQGLVTVLQNVAEQRRLTIYAQKRGMTLAQFIAEDAYNQADAMLQARTQPASYTEELHTED